MAGQQGSSFIPKQPARGVVQKRTVRKIYILAYISFVLFFGTLVAAGATFFYKVSVDAQLQNQRTQLVAQRESFSEADIERVKNLDEQIQAAEQILDNHVSYLPLLEALEASTVQTVQLSGLDINRTAEAIEVTLQAQTENFNSLLFQRSIAERNMILANATFEEVSANKAAITEFSPNLGANLFNEDALLVSFTLVNELTPSQIAYQPSTFVSTESGETFTDDTFTDDEFSESDFTDESITDTDDLDSTDDTITSDDEFSE